jgi:hypothetical protein
LTSFVEVLRLKGVSGEGKIKKIPKWEKFSKIRKIFKKLRNSKNFQKIEKGTQEAGKILNKSKN